MEQFVEKIIGMNEPKTIFMLCGIFISTDVLTGYLKAFKFHNYNYSKFIVDEISGVYNPKD